MACHSWLLMIHLWRTLTVKIRARVRPFQTGLFSWIAIMTLHWLGSHNQGETKRSIHIMQMMQDT